MAESPPPTTTSSLSRKKNPSHVAHADTPWPMSRVSDSMPRSRAEAPVAMITASAVKLRSSAFTVKGRRERSTSVAVRNMVVAPNRWACSRNLSIISGPRIPSGKPG